MAKTNDELAQAFRDLFVEAHAKVDALDDNVDKRRLQRHLAAFHETGGLFEARLTESGQIAPYDGVGKPVPNP